MRINYIEFENFRQFKERNRIEFSKSNNMTIIYGKNGNGKTTLHQLFQWIFYNSISFNKTATEKLYNLSYEKNLKPGEEIDTIGSIEFEHDNVRYLLERKIVYKKELSRLRAVMHAVVLLKYSDCDDQWCLVTKEDNEIRKIIEFILPSAMSDYFFFDGETMIADLKKTGKASAVNLKSALYSMFDLSHLENAITHIGNVDSKTTAIGSLYMSKKISSNDNDTIEAKNVMLSAQDQLEILKNTLENNKKDEKTNDDRIIEISELIGSVKSNEDYEKQRSLCKQGIETELKLIKSQKKAFGEELYKVQPKLLLKKRFAFAQRTLKDKIESSGKDLPFGLEKNLIETLLDENRTTCICGNHLGEKEKEVLRKYLMLFPPYSYTALYNRLLSMFNAIGMEYNEDKIITYFQEIFKAMENIDLYEDEIKLIDAEQKSNEELQSLVYERIDLENKNDIIKKENAGILQKIGLAKTLYKQQKNKYETLSNNILENKEINRKINILEQVKELLKQELSDYAKKYSSELKYKIEILLKEMLTTDRKVSVSPDFMVKIYDSFGDESKSEGQFAVVSFAYIGGILKMLQSEEHLASKEYPLVLDGPFSKLDPDQRQNVVDVIPQFAPQVILFSKDDLHEVFDAKNIGKVWTIVSNEEKNIARIEEGHLWN